MWIAADPSERTGREKAEWFRERKVGTKGALM